MEPLISVIMGVYNDEKYVNEAIDSILNQTLTNFEFIICNDCSTDKSYNIIKSYADKDERIILINNPVNMGLAQSLNNCISIAKADYLARMDSDDVSIANRLEIEYFHMVNNPNITVLGTQVNYINNNGVTFKTSSLKNLKPKKKDIVKKVCVIHPTVMMKKNKVIEVGMYSSNELTTRAEDYDLWCKLSSINCEFEILDEVLFNYREDIDGLKKRRYKFRIQECKLKFYWIKQSNMNPLYYAYAVKPLIVGVIPKNILKIIRKWG